MNFTSFLSLPSTTDIPSIEHTEENLKRYDLIKETIFNSKNEDDFRFFLSIEKSHPTYVDISINADIPGMSRNVMSLYLSYFFRLSSFPEKFSEFASLLGQIEEFDGFSKCLEKLMCIVW